MNTLQSLGLYCGTPSLSRNCAISAQYTKLFTVEKKRRYSWCLLRKKLMRALSERSFFFPSIGMPTVWQSPLTSWGRELDHSTSFGKMDVEHYLQEPLLRLRTLQTGDIFVTNVRKFFEDRRRNFITMSYRTTYWLRIRILEAVPVLSVDRSHVNSAEIAVSDMVCRLPRNHGNSKVQTPLAIGPPTQSLGACLAHQALSWSASLIPK